MKARRSATLMMTLALTVAAIVVGSVPAAAKSSTGAPSASFERFVLSQGTHTGTAEGSAELTLSGTLATGTYTDPFPAGSPHDLSYESGQWISPAITAPFDIDELVASWNVATPNGTWIKTEMQATGSGRTTKWYTLGIWASGDGTIHRTSVPAQGDADGFVAIDTFIRSKKAAPLRSYQLRVTLYRIAGSSRTICSTRMSCSPASRSTTPSTRSTSRSAPSSTSTARSPISSCTCRRRSPR